MKCYKMIVEYDGTNYHGFQRQKKIATIQGELERVLSLLFNTPISIVSSGRTDSGVHAVGHVISFCVDSKMSPRNILKGVNAQLPRDIVVKSVRVVPNTFHAQYSAKRKIYRYQVWNSHTVSPLRDRYTYHYTYGLDLKKMQKAAGLLIGKHDFRAFAAKNKDKENTIRTLYNIRISKQSNCILLTFDGDGFLYNMVRNIVGTLLYVGRGKFSVRDVKAIMAARKRAQAGPTVPAKGLTLSRVIY